VIGRLSEELSCRPSEAWAEWLQSPAGFLETLIEMRHYAKAYAIVEQDPKASGHEFFALVKQHDLELREADSTRGDPDADR
jgi:hypothetical protein